MPKINFKQAKEFLENINKEDKVAIITHDDLDGFSSGYLLLDFINTKTPNTKVFIHPTKTGYLKELIPQLKEFNKIILSDLFPSLIQNFLEPLKQKQILCIDHHQPEPISKSILEYRESEKYFPASKMIYDLINGKDWIALAGIIADYGFAYQENKELINLILKKLNLTLEEFKQKIVYPLNNFLIYFQKEEQKAFEIFFSLKSPKDVEKISQYSETIEKEITKIEEDFKKNKKEIGKFILYDFESKYKIKPLVISKIALDDKEKIYIFLSPKTENPGMLSLSARHQNEKADLPKLLKELLKDLENARAGGHKRASGGILQKKDLEKFKENIKKYSGIKKNR